MTNEEEIEQFLREQEFARLNQMFQFFLEGNEIEINDEETQNLLHENGFRDFNEAIEIKDRLETIKETAEALTRGHEYVKGEAEREQKRANTQKHLINAYCYNEAIKIQN